MTAIKPGELGEPSRAGLRSEHPAKVVEPGPEELPVVAPVVEQELVGRGQVAEPVQGLEVASAVERTAELPAVASGAVAPEIAVASAELAVGPRVAALPGLAIAALPVLAAALAAGAAQIAGPGVQVRPGVA